MNKESKENTIKSQKKELASNLSIRELGDADAKDFSEEVKEKLTTKAQEIIEAVEERMGKQFKWLLQLFPPQSEKEVDRRKLSAYKELESDFYYSVGSQAAEEDFQAMKRQGLNFCGTNEESDKAKKFLGEIEMNRNGNLEPLLNGYAILDLKGKQITITQNLYSLKYEGITDFAGVVEYLTQDK
jgi:hypothetical protein